VSLQFKDSSTLPFSRVYDVIFIAYLQSRWAYAFYPSLER
jgi:hypothetical protein